GVARRPRLPLDLPMRLPRAGQARARPGRPTTGDRMSRSKHIGTRAETAVTRYLQANGFPQRLLDKSQWTATGCLEFTGARTNGGYGKSFIGSRSDGSRTSV